MAEIYKYIETSGLIVPDTETLLNEVAEEFREAFGDDLVTTPESPGGLLINVETEARDSVVRNNAELANQINPDHAGGVFLDAIAALTGLQREGAASSLVMATLAGVPGTIIPAGSRAATEAGDVFASAAGTMLATNGQAKTLFRSEVQYAIPCPAGSLVTILDGGTLGWETITNEAAATLGQMVETDTVFRKKRDDTLFLQGVALPGAIQSGVRAVGGVKSLTFLENYSHEESVINNVTMPPHTVYLVVDGGEDAAIAAAIFTKKSLGCGLKGSLEIPVTEAESGQTYMIRFDRPEYVPVRARFTVRVTGSVSGDYQSVVRQAVIDYAADRLEGLRGFRVGTAVSPFEMAVAVGTVEPGIFVLDARVGPLSAGQDELTAQTIPLEVWQKAEITQASIDVVAE